MTRRIGSSRRRGTSYVFFLGTAMLVTIIGLSALAVAHVKLRVVGRSNEGASARLYAQSGIQAALLAVYSSATWRDSTAHDTWQTPQAIGDGTFTWKLVDENNGSFTADRNGLVRAYGKGVCGDSVWVYSVLVQPPLEALPGSVLVNSDLETSAVPPWQAFGSSTVMIDDWSPMPHGGTACLLVTGRSAGSGAMQPIAGLTSGASCRSSVLIKFNGSTENASFGIRVESGAGWDYFECGSGSVDTNWTLLEGTATPTWSGTLIQAQWVVSTDGTNEFIIDNATFVAPPPPVGPIPGSWRREAQ